MTPSEQLKALAIERANTPEYLRDMLAQVLSWNGVAVQEYFSYSSRSGVYKSWTVDLLKYEGDFDGI